MTVPGFSEEAGLIPWDEDSRFLEKTEKLKAVITSYSKVIVAFSGGCDSALVAKLSKDWLGAENALAVTSRSESLPRDEIREVERFVKEYDLQHQWILTEEIQNPAYSRNHSDRCYFCKTELYDRLIPIAQSRQAEAIFNGTNVDDLGDWRPGLKAASEHNIKSPLLEAGFKKQDVRRLARESGLFTWDKPAAACLSSRFAYGEAVSAEELRKIDRGEQLLRSYGFRVVRLRKLAENQARIEVGAEELSRLFAHPEKDVILLKIRALGFDLVDIDPEGYVSGKLNLSLRGKRSTIDEAIHG